MNSSESINPIRAFTGSAFLAPPANAKPLLVFTNSAISYMSTKQWNGHWNYTEITPTISISKWYQGATLEFHKEKIVLFGEATMFTSQYVNVYGYVGLKAKGAEQNEQFLLNIMHWLSHKT